MFRRNDKKTNVLVALKPRFHKSVGVVRIATQQLFCLVLIFVYRVLHENDFVLFSTIIRWFAGYSTKKKKKNTLRYNNRPFFCIIFRAGVIRWRKKNSFRDNKTYVYDVFIIFYFVYRYYCFIIGPVVF